MSLKKMNEKRDSFDYPERFLLQIKNDTTRLENMYKINTT